MNYNAISGNASTAETQPHLQPAFLRLSAMISQYFTATIMRVYDSAGNVIQTHEHAGHFREWWRYRAGNKKPPPVKRDG